MHAGLFDVLHDAADVQLFAVEQGIHVDFDGVLQELVDEQRGGQASGHDRVGLGLVERTVDVLGQLGVVVDDFHAASAEDVTGAHEHRIADVVGGLAGLFKRQRGAVARRVHVLATQHLTEQLAVLGQVDGLRGGAQDRHAGGLESRGQRQRRLAAELDDDALDRAHLLLGLIDLQHVLEGERLEVQPVRHVVVGGDGLGVAVDHDRVIVLAELLHRVHAGVVELDALTDAVRAGAEDDDGLAVALAQLGLVGVAGVVVRRDRVELGGAGVDGLVDRAQAVGPAQLANRVLALVTEIAQVGDLQVGQAGELRLLQQLGGEFLGVAHFHRGLVDEGQLLDEPRVDLGGVEDLPFGGAAPQSALNLQIAVLGRHGDGLEQFGDLGLVRLVTIPAEAHVALVDGAHGLAQRLLEVAAECHGLADGLHRRGQTRVGAGELLEREARHLGDHVVDGRLEGGHADVTQLLVFAIGQGEAGGHGDGVTGVHADRVDVLDRADDHDVVVAVAHQFELEFLPAFDALLQQHLVGRRVMQPGAGDAVQLLLVVRDAGAEASHGEARAHHQRVSEFGGDGVHFLHGVGNFGARGFGASLVDDLLEQLAVLAAVDGVKGGADQLDVVLLEHTGLAERHRGVQCGLATQGGQQGVGAFLGDDLFKDGRGDRLDVGGVGHLRVGHDRGRVGVHEDDADALFAQHAARLGAGVVELGRLPDHDRAGADDHH